MAARHGAGIAREVAFPCCRGGAEQRQPAAVSFRSAGSAQSRAPRAFSSRPSPTCRASSGGGVASDWPAKASRSQGGVPDELAALTELVDQLSQASPSGAEADVGQLKQAVGELAADIKRQISAPSLPAAPSRPFQPPGSTRFQPTTDAETFKQSSAFSDLDGVIPQPNAASPSDSDRESDGPSVPRSEVISMRSRLNKKLSESNTYNRYLLREIQYREDTMKNTKAVLMALVSELKDILNAANDLTAVESSLPLDSVSASSLPSVLKMKIAGLSLELERQLGGVEAMKLREVPVVWFGMAEDVKVMGSFDGWTYGEQLSPEATGTMTKFSTVLKLRPGTYEIKFLVDGEWRVAPEWPTVGHGMTENNVLVVE